VSAPGVVFWEMCQSWRALLRRPGYLVLSVLTLALGVAAVTTTFALFHSAILKSLPFPAAERLVTLGIEPEKNRTSAAPRYYAPLQRMQSVQSAGMLLGWATNTNVAFGDQAEVVLALHADRGFVDTLGLPMAAGRNFDAAENSPNGPAAVILSYEYWRTRFGADRAAIGRSLQLEGRAVQIVGVLSKEFRWPDRFELLVTLQPDLTDRDLSTNHLIVARLKPQASVAGAAAETHAVLTALLANDSGVSARQREYLQRNPPTALPLETSVFTSSTGERLWLFLGAAVSVLLAAAINLASLMLSRALARSHERAVREALGAPLSRMILPSLAEGALIGAGASLAGVALAGIGLQLLSRWVPAEWLRGDVLSLGRETFVFALVAGVTAALVAAFVGTVRRQDSNWMRELVGGGRAGWSRQSGRLGRALVIAQVAVSVVLLAAAALFARSLQKLESVPMGFRSESVATFTLAPIKARYVTASQMTEQTRRVLESLQRLPGVERAGASTNLPTGSQLNYPMILPDGRTITGQYRLSSPGFLETLRIPLLTGRAFAATDVAQSEPVCLVSASFARNYLGGDAIDKIVTLPMDAGPNIAARVVGVVGDVRQFGPGEPAPPILYTPIAQIPAEIWALLREFGPLSYAVRFRAGAFTADEHSLGRAVQEAAPQQPIANFRSMDAIVSSTTHQQQINLLLAAIFAGMALTLASLGIYAVMAVAVAARGHEFGVRAALGASPSHLLRQVLSECARQIGLGVAIGLAITLALSRVLQRFLFDVQAADPQAIFMVLLTLTAAGLLASLAPALRAASVEPMQMLRNE
jgi:predicted permease